VVLLLLKNETTGHAKLGKKKFVGLVSEDGEFSE